MIDQATPGTVWTSEHGDYVLVVEPMFTEAWAEIHPNHRSIKWLTGEQAGETIACFNLIDGFTKFQPESQISLAL